MTEEKKQQSLEIKIDPEVAQGRYSNLVAISHSESNFVLDFIFIEPQQPKGRVFSRVIASPQHAKKLLRALAENIGKFESRFGAIKESEQKGPPAEGMNYYH